MQDLESYLLSKEEKGVSSTELRHFGKQAAVRYVQNETPLNDSIAEFAKEAGLNLEQIKRVAEYANNDTFVTMFKLGFAKNITFPMADASAVAQTMNAPKVKTASVEKRHIPSNLRYVPGQENIDLEEVFYSGGDLEKVANIAKVKANMAAGMPMKAAIKKAYPDYTDEQCAALAAKLMGKEKSASADPEYISASVREAKNAFLDAHTENKNAEASKQALGDVFEIKLAALRDLCKEASATNSAGIIGYAIEAGEPSEGLMSVISERLGDLAEFGHGEELEKMGMGMMMPNPISGLTSELEGTAQKLTMTQQAVVKTQLAMQELLTILRGPDMSGPAAGVFGGGTPSPEPPMGPPPMGAPRPEMAPVGAPQAAAAPAPTPPAPAGPSPEPQAGPPMPGPQGPQGPGPM